MNNAAKYALKEMGKEITGFMAAGLVIVVSMAVSYGLTSCFTDNSETRLAVGLVGGPIVFLILFAWFASLYIEGEHRGLRGKETKDAD